MKRFGEKLKVLRVSKGLTLQMLALALGYTTHGYLSEIESGKKQPTIQFVLKVADMFSITTDSLLKDELDPAPVRLRKK